MGEEEYFLPPSQKTLVEGVEGMSCFLHSLGASLCRGLHPLHRLDNRGEGMLEEEGALTA